MPVVLLGPIFRPLGSLAEALANYSELVAVLGSLAKPHLTLVGCCKASLALALVTVYECKLLEAAKLSRNPATQQGFLSQMAIDWAKATKDMDAAPINDLVHPALALALSTPGPSSTKKNNIAA